MLYLSCQEILFFNHVQTEKRKASQRFPSPVGESYFSITSNSFIQCISNTRFRPLSGNLNLQWEGCAAVDDMNAFPSPVGESYFSIMMKSAIRKRKSGFPSPVGESYFSMKPYWANDKINLPVSVPYRGILFFNYVADNQGNIPYEVSVPYRGILFFNG